MKGRVRMPIHAMIKALMGIGAGFAAMPAAPASAQSPQAEAGLPQAIQAAGTTPALMLHAQGAQIYACQADSAGKQSWAYREPIAALLIDGKTVGRHYAGPTWELENGGKIQGKVSARAPAPGAVSGDIPWLKLEAIAPATGPLAGMRFIQRIHTHGGALEGACQQAGELRAIAYSADYVFLR